MQTIPFPVHDYIDLAIARDYALDQGKEILSDQGIYLLLVAPDTMDKKYRSIVKRSGSCTKSQRRCICSSKSSSRSGSGSGSWSMSRSGPTFRSWSRFN